MLILTSWDDGNPSDIRLAELLSRFGLKGTFFIPIQNSEGRSVLTPEQIRHIAQNFEVGAHTLDHMYLDKLIEAESRRQILDSRQRLEDICALPVHGFCYPGGRITKISASIIKSAGFKYARTTENFCFNIGKECYRMPTTIQFYPHSAAVYIRNYLRHGAYLSKWSAVNPLLTKKIFQEKMRDLAVACANSGGVFHLWGHSWELDEYGLWDELESFLQFLTSLPHEVKFLNECVW